MSIENLNPRYEEYNQYLDNHISGVKRVWHEMLRHKIEELLVAQEFTEGEIQDFLLDTDIIISRHDDSKFSKGEYEAYLNYFYPTEEFPKDEEKFNRAWLLHQNKNAHHYQYWVLIEDSGETEALDMPLSYICEMICDWSSFKYVKEESTANNWYSQNREKMILSEKTREIIETLLELDKDL